jgi:hypothetical protein
MFKIKPTIEYAFDDMIDVVFKENFYGYSYITVRLYKLPTKDAARQFATDAAADSIINHILTKRFIRDECKSILEKVR